MSLLLNGKTIDEYMSDLGRGLQDLEKELDYILPAMTGDVRLEVDYPEEETECFHVRCIDGYGDVINPVGGWRPDWQTLMENITPSWMPALRYTRDETEKQSPQIHVVTLFDDEDNISVWKVIEEPLKRPAINLTYSEVVDPDFFELAHSKGYYLLGDILRRFGVRQP